MATKDNNTFQQIEVILKLLQPIIVTMMILGSVFYLTNNANNNSATDKRLQEINNSISEIKKMLNRNDISGSKKVSPANSNSESKEKKSLDKNNTSQRVKD